MGDNTLASADDEHDEQRSAATPETNIQPPKSRKSCEDMHIKQGKQIRALYELHKETLEKVTWIQNQIKLQNEKKKKLDLSEKVFNVSKKSLKSGAILSYIITKSQQFFIMIH